MLKAMKERELKLVNVKVTAWERAELQKRADQYCRKPGHARGNLSEWLRYAGLNHEPSDHELATDAPAAGP